MLLSEEIGTKFSRSSLQLGEQCCEHPFPKKRNEGSNHNHSPKERNAPRTAGMQRPHTKPRLLRQKHIGIEYTWVVD